MKFKDLKLDCELRSLVVKFMAFRAEEAKVKGGGSEQVLVRRLACANENAFFASTPKSLYKNAIDNGNSAGRTADHGWSFFFGVL